ncbi:uncharacterized protein M437DRAFT_62106 [Aureobasidium melanogenum CBS 110374]|uniref:Uncharacterized protein n=1 Tax=Aureobasidium melanogenum (strain CBS 110374) TaxID=1043003 RepID=A0A074W826_AURM1|nr:uncharacterized protein M437DRAFT_62106 [Aureobasidium melanogenum CBS 110374]KEQ67729.1 hypothetical protein M437DRAFT_62106 [Aureobasidium melanogenum CBS 110374]
MKHVEAFDKLQAEVLALKEENKVLKKDNAVLKRVNTRSKNHKAKISKSKQGTKVLWQQKKSRTTNAAAKKLLKENEKYKLLIEEKDQQLEEKDQQYNALLEEDDEERRDLSDQNLKFKQEVASSSRLDNQISDETFHEVMSCAFVAIKECFYNVLRKQGFNVVPSPAYWQEYLDKYLPDNKDNTKEVKMNLCILAVSLVLVDVVNSEMVFGWPHNKLVRAATKCYQKIPEPRDPEKRKKIKQWLSLTNEVLTDNGQGSMNTAKELVLKFLLDESQRIIEILTDLKINESIRGELSDALEPLLQTVCMLDYQKWQFSFDLVSAMGKGERSLFDPSEMEGMFAEKAGWVKASLFPQLCRLEQDDQENQKRTVVCKARVTVMSTLPIMTNAIGQDTKMSEDIKDGPEPGFTATVDKNSEIEKPSEPHSQDQDQDKTVEGDLGKPMNEDAMVDALRAGSGVYIDLCETPERSFPEKSIPDSFDRAEEETMDQSRAGEEQRRRIKTACVSSRAKKSESVAAGTSQQDMYQITMPGQLDGPLHSPETVVDTATTATIIVRATLLSATSTARASLQSATLTATFEWSSDDCIIGGSRATKNCI